MKNQDDFMPSWRTRAPEKGSFREVFKWGAPASFSHPTPGFFRLLKERLELDDRDFERATTSGDEPVACDIPTDLTDEQTARLVALVGRENVALDDFSRVKFSTGKTMEEALRLRSGEVRGVADVVVHPRSSEDVKALVSYCSEQGIPLTPYSGGSSVTLGLRCERGGVALAISTHLNRVIEFDETNQTITVEPGISGPQLERALNEAPERFGAQRRYTCGHFPQSFEFSTVGGWIVTLGSGQQSSYYGDMRDLVLGQEYVTPTGSFRTRDYPACATGPRVGDVMLGSEGAFGVLTRATLKVFRHTPKNRRRFAFAFKSFEEATTAAREIFQGEFGCPSMFRLSDAEETAAAFRIWGLEGTKIDKLLELRGYRDGRRCLCIGHADGDAAFARLVQKKAKSICRRNGAMSLSGYPVKRWERGRFTDPYLREDLADFGVVVDTLETSVKWGDLHRVHRGVRELMAEQPRTLLFSHASHFYPQGTNLYFIFIMKPRGLDDYLELQRQLVDAIEGHGGSLSHHHGVGKLLAPWMGRHLGPEQMGVLRALKRHFDPESIMNPGGTLGLDLDGSPEDG